MRKHREHRRHFLPSIWSKCLAVLLVLCLIASAAGCTPSGKDNSSSGSTSSEQSENHSSSQGSSQDLSSREASSETSAESSSASLEISDSASASSDSSEEDSAASGSDSSQSSDSSPAISNSVPHGGQDGKNFASSLAWIDSSDAAGMLALLNTALHVPTQAVDALCGTWALHDETTGLYLEFRPDQTFTLAQKQTGCDFLNYTGVWTYSQSDGNLYLLCKQADGDGSVLFSVWSFVFYGSRLFVFEQNNFSVEPNDAYTAASLLPDNPDLLSWQFSPAVEDWEPSAVSLKTDQNDPDANLLAHMYFFNNNCLTNNGNLCTYSCDVPEFYRYNSDAAATLNDQIFSTYGPIARAMFDSYDAFEEPEFQCIWKRTEEYGNMISLLIGATYYNGGEDLCSLYVYDYVNDRVVKNEEIFQHFGITAEEFVQLTQNAAEAYLTETYAGVSEEDKKAYGYDDIVKATLQDDNIYEDMPIFIDGAGNLAVLCQVGNLAGSSWSWEVLYPLSERKKPNTPGHRDVPAQLNSSDAALLTASAPDFDSAFSILIDDSEFYTFYYGTISTAIDGGTAQIQGKQCRVMVLDWGDNAGENAASIRKYAVAKDGTVFFCFESDGQWV